METKKEKYLTIEDCDKILSEKNLDSDFINILTILENLIGDIDDHFNEDQANQLRDIIKDEILKVL